MAEIKPQDLVYTYMKLTKKVSVYASPEIGDAGKPIWFEKQAGEVTGRLFSWIDTSPTTGKKYKSIYLMFKVGDDFSNGVKPYFVKFEPKLIDWAFTKQQLIAKGQADMNFFQKFVDDMENKAIDYAKDIYNNYVVPGFKTGLVLSAIGAIIVLVVIPYAKFRFIKYQLKDVIKEAKRA
jgi:hypothetical protein